MLASPRVFFAMADDGLLFKTIATVHPRYKTPYVAILLAAVLGIALVMSRSFEALTDTFVLAIWPFYAVGVAAIYRLRRDRPDLPRPYRAIGYPVVPAIFILSVAAFVINALINDTVNSAITLCTDSRGSSGVRDRVRASIATRVNASRAIFFAVLLLFFLTRPKRAVTLFLRPINRREEI